jgi:hypothetical protein
MHPSVARLIGIFPPASTPQNPDWARVERTLGTPLPDDYKQLIEMYGGGVFDETIWLLEPDCADEGYDLVGQAQERDEVLANLWSMGEPKPAELEADGVRVIPWAYIEGSGHYLFWLTRPGEKPAEWTTILNEGRGPEWEHHPQSCADFLVGVMTGEVDSLYFSDLPAEIHRFDSNAGILSAQ